MPWRGYASRTLSLIPRPSPHCGKSLGMKLGQLSIYSSFQYLLALQERVHDDIIFCGALQQRDTIETCQQLSNE